MKKAIIVLSILLISGFIYLYVEGKAMNTVETQIEISATPEKVWSVLMDIPKWNDWNPTMNKISGSPSLGSKLDIIMVSKEGKGRKDGPKYSPVVKEVDAPRYFRWKANMVADLVFTNEKIFILEESGSGTKLTHKETFKGLMVPMMKGHLETGVKPMLESMNKALKKVVEELNQ